MSGPSNRPGRPASTDSPAASRSWRARQSAWLTAPVLGGGCFSGLPLVVLGLRAKRPSWWIAGAIYTALAWVGFSMVGVADIDTPVSDWGVGIWLAAWLACILHAVLINDAWLQWRAGYTPWYEDVPAGLQPPPKAPTPRPASASAAGVDSPTDVGSPLDLNNATMAQLAALPVLGRRLAQRIVREREARGGFLAVTDIIDVAGLAPHEFARIRDRLVCVPPPAPGPSKPGRVVDV